MEENKNIENEVNEKINPEDIVFEENADEEMPEPKTAQYNDNEDQGGYVRLSYTFMQLFTECLGKLPYASTLTNGNDSIKLINLVKFVEAKQTRIGIKELNTILNFVGNCPLETVRPLMEIVEDKSRQTTLWEILQNN